MIGDIKNRTNAPVKIRLEDNTPITGELIGYCLNQARQGASRLELLERYYQNRTAIQSRILTDPEKPNNRISHAFAKYITKIATAYFMGYGIRYETDDKPYKEALDEILNANMTKIRHFEEAKEMSKSGIAFELLYIDPDGKLRTQQFGAGEMIPVFSASPGNFLAMALRPYSLVNYLGRNPERRFVEVYTKHYVETWKKTGHTWALAERFSHNFSDVPVIVRFNNAELKGDYEDIIPQIDAYDKAQSDTANDQDYFTDAYLWLDGLDDLKTVDENGDEQDAAKTGQLLKEDRMICTPAGSKVGFVTKNNSDVTPENHKKRIYKDIFFLAQVPNLTDEEFAGNLSGVAIKYKLFGLEELSIEKETYFTSSEIKKVRFITEYLNALHNTSYDWKSVTLKFDRSAVANTYEIAQIMNMLRDIISDETLIGMFPDVKDIGKELERKTQENIQKENREYPPNDGAAL